MRIIVSVYLFLTIFLSCSYPSKNELLKKNEIKIKKGTRTEVLIIKNFKGQPDEKGLLQQWTLKLPAIKRGFYFACDGSSPYGFISNNRSHLWILDSNYNIINPPNNPEKLWYLLRSISKEGNFAVFELENGKYIALSPMLGEKTISYLYFDQNELPLICAASLGTERIEADVPVLAYTMADNIYEAAYKTYESITGDKIKGLYAQMRGQKNYPEYFKYLGWCSWEEFKRNIPEDTILKVMSDIHNSGVPVRWILIDDGTQWSRKVSAKEMLYSFSPDPELYPNGFHNIRNNISENGIKWLGIWHHQCGYFAGVDEENIMGQIVNDQLEILPNGQLMPKSSENAMNIFYKGLFNSTIEAKFDFVKVDFQDQLFEKYLNTKNPVYAKSLANQKVENLCRENGLGLINCIASGLASVQSTKYSNVSRVSQDYVKNKADGGPLHIYQSYNNLLWMGQVVFGDHDMFHSSDITNRIMSVSKAMSAAPIYLSDAPKDFNKEYIMPLCYNDGELIRPLAPALPMIESFFSNPLNENKQYKVIAPLENKAAAIVIYNLNYGVNASSLKGIISKEDYSQASALIQPYPGEWEIPRDGIILYDWDAQCITELDSFVEFELEPFSDRLVHLCPINKGWAVIGRQDKYLSPATIQNLVYSDNQISFQVQEAGSVAFFLKSGIPLSDKYIITKKANGLWIININDVPSDKKILIRKS